MKTIRIVFSLLMLGFVAGLTPMPVLTAAGLVALSLLPLGNRGLLVNGVELETWNRYIVERFWKDNAFLRYVSDEDDNVVAGRIVHIPQPGAKPQVEKNRSVFPATAVRRADTDIVYALDEYTTDPTHIPNIDSIHLSYNKQDSVLGDHVGALNELVADDILIKWASSTNVAVRSTTGGPNATTMGPVSGQTGNRLIFHHKDLQKLMIEFNVANVPKNDRYILIDDVMYEGFYDSLSDTQAKDFSRYMDAENGIVGKLHSFNIMTRSSVLAVTNANAIKPLGSALGATDHLASIAWQRNSLARAMGSVKLFQDTNNPLYYGDIYSVLIMMGGRCKRADGKGVVVLRQGTPS